MKGRPRPGAICKLKDLRPPAAPSNDWELPVVYEGRTDREGTCRTGRFPAGTYFFSAAMEGGASLKRTVVLENGVETAQDLAFSRRLLEAEAGAEG